MSTEHVFNAEVRQSGKHHSRVARKANKVPTVIYGPKFQNLNVFIEENTIKKYLSRRFESTIFSLKSGDSKLNDVKVLIKKIQVHPVTDRPVHLDLYALDMASKVRVTVVIEYVGVPAGVKEEGGIFQTVLHEIEIESLPANIPSLIKADVSGLNLNSSLHVSDLVLPDGVRAVTPAERTLAVVSAYVEEAAAAPTAAAAAPVAGAAAAPAAGAAAPAAGAAAPAAAAAKPKK
jgi:large subunit ribosomal protein L25